VYVDFPLPEAQLSMAAPGRVIRGRAAAWPQREFTGAIAIVDARIDPATRAVMVRADLPNPERLLRPGMLVTVELPGATREALLVPEIAVVQVGRESFLYRVKDDGSVERVDVVVGARSGGKAEVVEGAKAGDRIVVDGTGKLRPGAKVVEAAAPAAAGGGDAKPQTPTAAPGG
jgi:membrane fusion protein (multidrug efflux system)